jgi:hypothetical protein
MKVDNLADLGPILALKAENERMRKALEEIRDIARVSEGVEFYAMLAQKALDGND